MVVKDLLVSERLKVLGGRTKYEVAIVLERQARGTAAIPSLRCEQTAQEEPGTERC
jgi:hypothetical protein